MTYWEEKIINTLIEHYYSSAARESKTLRLRTSIIFPDFDSASHDDKTSYLEAAEFLEQKNVIKLRWEKRRKGERLLTISCNDIEALFEISGKLHPKDEVEKIKNFLSEKISCIKNNHNDNDQKYNLISLLEYFIEQFNSKEIGQGINLQIMDELIRLLEFSCDEKRIKSMTVRALSILLYNDSKHLERLLDICSSLLTRAKRITKFNNFYFPQRAYPEAAISGKLIFELNNSNTPLVNAEGFIINLPFDSIEFISLIKPITEKHIKTVLTIENKETFYALGNAKNNTEINIDSPYDCYLYTGGYPNSAAAALIRTLASSGFSFFHAGDLDPDGILILQNIQEIVHSVCPEKIITPVKMDKDTFNQYSKWTRPLTKNALRQTEKISKETREILNLAELIRCIEETGKGIEQEIIDYG